MGDTIQVNFGRPIALFPLANVVLLPHALQPLRIFEARYRQMLEECLDSAGQIAMATFQEDPKAMSSEEYEAVPALRPAVCVGQIVQHQKLSDSLHDIVMLGVCRATIVDVQEPEGERLYRTARLRPTEVRESEPDLTHVRDELRGILTETEVSRMSSASRIAGFLDREDVPTSALIELLSFELVNDPDLKYELLAETSPEKRAELVVDELQSLDTLIRVADRQPWRSWPKGISWN